MPKLSIITPVYNTIGYIESMIKSVLNQTFEDFELILVDDGSTDGSEKVLDEYAKLDSRVKVIHKPNGGVASARNAGLDAALGDYIGWVDSDDMVSPVMYEILMDIACKYNADIVQCENKREWDMLVLEKPEALPEPVVTDGLGSLKLFHGPRYANYMSLWSKIYRKNLFDDLRFTVGQVFEDDEFTPRLLYKGKVNCFIDLPLYRYNFREGSIVITSKPTDIVILLERLEKRMLWFREFDQKLYTDSKAFFFGQLKNMLCLEKYLDTPVQHESVRLLKKYRKEFSDVAHFYDKITIRLLYGGNSVVKWVSRNEFSPVQNLLARIKRLGKSK